MKTNQLYKFIPLYYSKQRHYRYKQPEKKLLSKLANIPFSNNYKKKKMSFITFQVYINSVDFYLIKYLWLYVDASHFILYNAIILDLVEIFYTFPVCLTWYITRHRYFTKYKYKVITKKKKANLNYIISIDFFYF